VKQALATFGLITLSLSIASCRYELPTSGRAGAPLRTAATDPAPASGAPVGALPAMPPGHPPIPALADTSAAPQTLPAASLLTGEVIETMNGAGYTYLLLRGERGELWVAVPQVAVSAGQTVSIAPQMTMKDFESTSLNRKFDSIVFGTLAGPAGPVPATPPNSAPQAAMPPGHPMPGMGGMQGMGGMSGGASKIEPGQIKVAKAEGADGRTVEEIWTNHAALKDKQVVVRGKVVKFLPEIMGKNWIHLQDGTGSAENRTNDITVTTTDKAVAGDVVIVTGTIHTDVNLGAGYAYPVIIEDAKLKK